MKLVEELLRNWRESRNIKDFPTTIKDDMLSEVNEVRQAQEKQDINNYVEEIADVAIFALNGIGLLNREYQPIRMGTTASLNNIEKYISSIDTKYRIQTVNMLNVIITMCNELVTAKKYDFKEVLNQKIQVISSREQNPQQKEEWVRNGANGKWLKNELQDKATIYKANYGKCKIR